MLFSWFALAGKAVLLGFEAQNVIVLRLMRLLAGGRLSQAEAVRMVTDKMAAITEAQIIGANAVTGQRAHSAAGKILPKYKKRVGANRRRLSGR